MTSYKKGDVVLVPFPFSDQSGAKKRPAVVVSSNEYNSLFQDVVILAITSRFESESFLINDREIAGLLLPSAIKPVVSTVDKFIIIKKIGFLSEADTKVLEMVKKEIFG